MTIRYAVPVLLLGALTACHESVTSSVDEVVVDTEFTGGSTGGWVVEFADYPEGEEEFYELESGVRPLPAPLDTTRRALFVSGSNRSDDLFMYLKRPVEGLTPGATYRVRFDVEIASNEGSGCVGAGGAPGEAVVVKAGASAQEPVRALAEDGLYRLNLDKGNQSTGGKDAVVIGDLANGSDECSGGDYRLKRLQDASVEVRATADAAGKLWLLLGTDSGYEGITSMYYNRIRVVLQRQ